jgi:uncharacterized membrane protein
VTESSGTNGVTGHLVAITAAFIVVASAVAIGTFSAGGWGPVMGLMWFWMVAPLLVLLLLVAFFVDKVEEMGRPRKPDDPRSGPRKRTDYEGSGSSEVHR